jgi:hypothetical protein
MDDQLEPISRRRLLKRLGAGTAVAWSAPILLSIRTPAYAQASPTCGPVNCLDPDLCGPDSACPRPPGCEGGICSVLREDNGCLCWDLGFCDPENVLCDEEFNACGPEYMCVRTDPNCGCAGNVACVCPCGETCPDLAGATGRRRIRLG